MGARQTSNSLQSDLDMMKGAKSRRRERRYAVALLCFALAVITTVGCGSDSERAPADTGASAEK
jgi:ribosomal protein L32